MLLAIVYCTHLDWFPLHLYTDEARRALVSAEMMMSGDYITPTINGEIYLNKPPLYNWIVALYFKIWGSYSMFAFRLPVIIATFGLGATVFYFFRKHTYRWLAFFTAIAFMTNGRILLYDSLQGLIDTTFSWVVFLNFMLIYHLGEQKKYIKLFLLTYFITALGFLMKGLPAVVFQGLTLCTYFILKKEFRRLFSLSHLAGIVLFIFLTGIYYVAYFANNDLSPSSVFQTVFWESSKRTAIKFGLKDTLLHLLTFPFEFLYHFAPWTIFVMAVIQRNVYKKIAGHPFMHYLLWIFLVNIIIYWSSVEVFARYLLMFVPLVYAIFLFLFDKHASQRIRNTIENILLGAMILILVFSIILPFLPALSDAIHLPIRSAILIAGFATALFIAIKYRTLRLYAFVLALIVLRIGFNWFVVERRTPQFFAAKKLAAEIHMISGPEELYLLKDVRAGNFDPMSFHLSTLKGSILRYRSDIVTSAFYIADVKQLNDKDYIEYLQFENYLSDTLKLVKFIHED